MLVALVVASAAALAGGAAGASTGSRSPVYSTAVVRHYLADAGREDTAVENFEVELRSWNGHTPPSQVTADARPSLRR